jgi:hypothetical protein
LSAVLQDDMLTRALLGFMLVGCISANQAPGASPDAASGGVHMPRTNATEAPPDIRRPLAVPNIESDARCPADLGSSPDTFPGAEGFTPPTPYVAYGKGAVAPVFVGPSERAVLSFARMPKHEGRAFEKLIWIVAPGTRVPVLIRGVADGGAQARFMTGLELVLTGPGTHPMGYVYFPRPGCYAFQIDSPSGTERVVIEVMD